jgi:hypothetical protein
VIVLFYPPQNGNRSLQADPSNPRSQPDSRVSRLRTAADRRASRLLLGFQAAVTIVVVVGIVNDISKLHKLYKVY